MPRPKFRPKKTETKKRLQQTHPTPITPDNVLQRVFRDYYNIETASVILGASSRTVSEVVKRGELKATKVGNTLLFSRDALSTYVEQVGV